MILLDNQTNIEIEISLLEKIASASSKKDIELLFVNEQEMKKINFEHRGKDTTTDVLSFPLGDFPHTPLGSIIINVDLAQQKADELAHKFNEEITLLFIHGLLHLLGYDHEIDRER